MQPQPENVAQSASSRQPDTPDPPKPPEPPQPDRQVSTPDVHKKITEQTEERVSQIASPAQTAPNVDMSRATQVTEPSSGRPARADAQALLNWERALVSRLEHAKRYPEGARGATGTVLLSFKIDRRGYLVSSRIARSSGSAALDAETLSLVERSQPFPLPPNGQPDRELFFVVPIRYTR